jgi:hypothetical protein
VRPPLYRDSMDAWLPDKGMLRPLLDKLDPS